MLNNPNQTKMCWITEHMLKVKHVKWSCENRFLNVVTINVFSWNGIQKLVLEKMSLPWNKWKKNLANGESCTCFLRAWALFSLYRHIELQQPILFKIVLTVRISYRATNYTHVLFFTGSIRERFLRSHSEPKCRKEYNFSIIGLNIFLWCNIPCNMMQLPFVLETLKFQILIPAFHHETWCLSDFWKYVSNICSGLCAPEPGSCVVEIRLRVTETGLYQLSPDYVQLIPYYVQLSLDYVK